MSSAQQSIARAFAAVLRRDLLIAYRHRQDVLNPLIFFLIVVSIVWALFNCLPIYPLDGGHMLGSILGPRREKVLYLTGAITALVVGLLAVYFRQLFVAIFMGMFAYQNYQHLQQHK